MPIFRIGIRQGRDVLHDFGKRIATRRCPKADSSSGKLQEFYQYQNEDGKKTHTSISYAKLNHVSGVKGVPHFSTRLTIHTRFVGVEPTPYFN